MANLRLLSYEMLNEELNVISTRRISAFILLRMIGALLMWAYLPIWDEGKLLHNSPKTS